MAGTSPKYDAKSVVTTEEREVTRDGVTTKTTVRTSTVRNKIQMMDGSGKKAVDADGKPVTYEQTFSMVNDPDAAMMTFSTGHGDDKKELASIIKTIEDGKEKYYLKISEEVLASLPDEVKEDIFMMGDQAMLAIEPIDGKPPIEVDASTGEMKVNIKAKDGSHVYSCNFSATGVRVVYDEATSDYKPKDAEGKPQMIDVAMSTSAFEDMCRMNSGMFQMKGAKKEDGKEMLAVSEIPAFMLGTYIETKNDFLTKEGEPETESGFATVTIPVTPGGSPNSQDINIGIARFPTSTPGHPKDHYMVQDSQVNAKGERHLFYLQNGKFQRNTQGKRHFYRCRTDATGKKIESAQFVVHIGSDDRKIDLALKTDGSDVTDEVAAVLAEMEKFTGTNPVSVQEGRTKLDAPTSGISFDASDPSEPKPIDPTIKGYTLEEEEENEKRKDDPPPPPPPKKLDLPKGEEVKPKKYTQTPGQLAIIAGVFLILASILLGPVGMAILSSVGVAMVFGGSIYCVNVDKFNNSFNQVKRYYIKPYKEKDLTDEHAIEAAYESDQARAKADAEYGSAVEAMAESDFMKVFEAFGPNATAMAAQFLGDDNLEKREDFLRAMDEYLNTPYPDTPEGREAARKAQESILQTFFRTPNDPMLEGAQLDELKAKLFNDKVAEQVEDVKKLTEAQRARQDARTAQAEIIQNCTDTQFARLINNPKRSEEHNANFVTSNADAIARRILNKNLSDEEMAAFNASLPNDAARAAVSDAMARARANAEEVGRFAEQKKANAQRVDDYATYQETSKVLGEKSAAEVSGPDTRPADYADYVTESTAATSAMQYATAHNLYLAQETYVNDLEAENISEGGVIDTAIQSSASGANSRVTSETALRNTFLENAGFFADSITHPRTGTLSEQIAAARREEAMRNLRETDPVAAREITDATSTDDIVSKIPAGKRSEKLKNLNNAQKRQERIDSTPVPTLSDVTTELRARPKYPVADWDIHKNIIQSRFKEEERAKLDAITDPAKKEEVLNFVAAAKTADPALSISDLIDMATSGAVARLAGESVRAGDTSATTRSSTINDSNSAAKNIINRRKQEQLLNGLTEEQRKAVQAKVREMVADGAAENFQTLQAAVTEVVGSETMPDGRTFDELNKGKTTPEQLQHNFTREEGYRRKALSRKLGEAQVRRLEEDHIDVTATEEAAAYVKARDKHKEEESLYEDFCETLDRIAKKSSDIAREDLTKAPADRTGQKILTSDDIRTSSDEYLRARSAARVQELINGLGFAAGDPMLAAIRKMAESSDTSAAAADKLKNLLAKRDRILNDPDIDLFNKANEEIVTAHGMNASSEPPKTTIEERLEQALRDELIAYLGTKSVPNLTTKTLTQLLDELNKPVIGGAPAGSRLEKLLKAYGYQKQIEGNGISKTSDLQALTSAMELDSGAAPIRADATTAATAAVDAVPAIVAGLTNPTEIQEKRNAAIALIARYLQNNASLATATPEKLAEEATKMALKIADGTLSLASKYARSEKGAAETGVKKEEEAKNNLKTTLENFDNQFKEVLAILTPAQRKAVKALKPKTWIELRNAVQSVLGEEKLSDGRTLNDARSEGTTPAELHTNNGKVDTKARERLERKIGKEAAAKLIEKIERHEAEMAEKKVREDDAERALIKELQELQKEIKAAEAMTDKKAQAKAFKKIGEKCKDPKYQSLFKKKKQKKIDKVKEKIAKRIKEHKEKIAKQKQEGLTMKQIEDRTKRYEDVKSRADEAAEHTAEGEATSDTEATRETSREGGVEADAE